jgi:SSS family solute:Na+ symporter
MAANFWRATVAWSVCFVVTIALSFITKPKADADLQGLVWGMSSQTAEEKAVWYKRPVVLASIVGVMALLCNLIFW